MIDEERIYPPFPEFERFVVEHNLIEKAKGNLSAKLPRILGQGTTSAVGLDLPPAPIEQKLELARLEFPSSMIVPERVKAEIKRVREVSEQEMKELSSEEGARRLASRVVGHLPQPRGIKNNFFYSGRFLLIPDKKRQSWSWSITQHYPVISKIPPDVDYLVKAFEAGDRKLAGLVLEPREFEDKLRLSWLMAKHLSGKEEVLIVDVARTFLVAAQDNRFWSSPQRKNFKDLPEAAFILNFLEWKQKHSRNSQAKFELMPAVLKEALSSDASVFYLPLDYEGTQTRPYIYLKMSSD